MPHQKISPFLRSAARSMRGRPIDVEEAVWWRLRARKLGGFKFRRQYPIGGYIADFACLDARLVVELDGIQHSHSLTHAERTAALKKLGFAVIRFDNNAVRIDIDKVCQEILTATRGRAATPHPAASQPPSPAGGEG